MRVAIDASPLRAPFGGISRYTQNLIASLARLDRETEFICFGAGGVAPRPECGPNFRWDELHFPLKSLVNRVALSGAARTAELIHGTNYAIPFFNTERSVLTIYDLSVYLLPKTHPRLRRLHHRFLPTLCRRSRRIVAVSHATKTDLVRHYRIAPEKIDVVHLAAGDQFSPVRDLAELERVREHHALPPRFILFVGCLEPRKNLETLLTSVALLTCEESRVPLVIAGSGSPAYGKRLREAAQKAGLREGQDVRFLGLVPDSDLPALYSLCDAFVYPSLYEGFGLPPLEAMACGAPVLMPANSAFSELYADYGALTDVSDARRLAETIDRLLVDRALRDDLVAEGLKRARARSWDAVAIETLDVYRRVLAGA